MVYTVKKTIKNKTQSMLDKDTSNDKTIQNDKLIFAFHDDDLFPLSKGKRSSEMSVPGSYQFIVDWQMSESESEVESTQIQ